MEQENTTGEVHDSRNNIDKIAIFERYEIFVNNVTCITGVTIDGV
jgi:hypothetical protein